MTINDVLNAHGYHNGSDEERLLQVFKDFARERAINTIYKMALPPHLEPLVQQGIREFVDK